MKGAEFELGQKLTNHFSMYGSVTYINSQMKQDLKVSTTLTESTAGKQLPDTPKFMAAIALSYKEGPLFGQLTAKHTGKAFSTLVNDQFMDPYVLLNLTAGQIARKPSSNHAEFVHVDNLRTQGYKVASSPIGSSFTTRACPWVHCSARIPATTSVHSLHSVTCARILRE